MGLTVLQVGFFTEKGVVYKVGEAHEGVDCELEELSFGQQEEEGVSGKYKRINRKEKEKIKEKNSKEKINEKNKRKN